MSWSVVDKSIQINIHTTFKHSCESLLWFEVLDTYISRSRLSNLSGSEEGRNVPSEPLYINLSSEFRQGIVTATQTCDSSLFISILDCCM